MAAAGEDPEGAVRHALDDLVDRVAELEGSAAARGLALTNWQLARRRSDSDAAGAGCGFGTDPAGHNRSQAVGAPARITDPSTYDTIHFANFVSHFQQE